LSRVPISFLEALSLEEYYRIHIIKCDLPIWEVSDSIMTPNGLRIGANFHTPSGQELRFCGVGQCRAEQSCELTDHPQTAARGPHDLQPTSRPSHGRRALKKSNCPLQQPAPPCATTDDTRRLTAIARTRAPVGFWLMARAGRHRQRPRKARPRWRWQTRLLSRQASRARASEPPAHHTAHTQACEGGTHSDAS
jgi:hypothetical protein